MKQIQGTSYNIEDDIVGALPLVKVIGLGVPTIYWFVMIRINPHSVI